MFAAGAGCWQHFLQTAPIPDIKGARIKHELIILLQRAGGEVAKAPKAARARCCRSACEAKDPSLGDTFAICIISLSSGVADQAVVYYIVGSLVSILAVKITAMKKV